MSKGVLDFTGVKYDAKAQKEKPHFRKKDGGEWSLDPGSIDFTQFPVGKLYIVWENWVAQSASKEIPSGGGGGKGNWKPPPYHPQTFVSNVVGQAIAAGCIKSPADIPEWGKMATLTIQAVNRMLEGKSVSEPSVQPQTENPAPQDEGPDGFAIPF